MSCGYYPQSAVVISPETLYKVCPEEIDNLQQFLLKHGVIDYPDVNTENIQALIYSCEQDYISYTLTNFEFELEDANLEVQKLLERFEKKTGLSLEVVHNDDPSRGDDLDGFQYSVEGAVGLTKKGLAFKKNFGDLKNIHWNVFG